MGQGLQLRGRVVAELGTWSALAMLTFTVDPELFQGPEHAYRYVRARRAIAKTIETLHRSGCLRSRRFVMVVEFHKNGWPHFHVLVESNFIPFRELAKAWGRFRPRWAPRWLGSYGGSLKGMRPEFGTCRVSVRAFESAKHAAGYALKYIIKHPDAGFPAWVLDYKGRVRRFETSRGLLPAKRKPPEPEVFKPQVRKADEEDQPGRTVRQRLATCGERAMVVETVYVVDAEGKEKRQRPRFVCSIVVGFKACCEVLGVPSQVRRFTLRPGELQQMTRWRNPGSGVVAGVVQSDRYRSARREAA